MDPSLEVLASVFYSDKAVSRKQLYALFDQIGVPSNTCWRSIFRMIFDSDVELHPGVDRVRTQAKLEQVMQQALGLISGKRYGENDLTDLVKNYNAAFVSVCHKELSDALTELDGFTKEFKSICMNRQGNIEVLEKETLKAVASDLSIKDKIHRIKQRFRQTIELFQADVVKLDQMNHTDHLTGLYNRRFFDKQLGLEVEAALKEKTWLHLLMIDIDDFKLFNDTYGHVIGDQALKTVAKHIRSVCRTESDKTGIYFFPTRYGGEEFAVILPAVETAQAGALADSIRQSISDYTFVIRSSEGTIKHKGLKLTVSIGVAALTHDVEMNPKAGENLIKKADAALFEAKEAGKNRVIVAVIP